MMGIQVLAGDSESLDIIWTRQLEFICDEFIWYPVIQSAIPTQLNPNGHVANEWSLDHDIVMIIKSMPVNHDEVSVDGIRPLLIFAMRMNFLEFKLCPRPAC